MPRSRPQVHVTLAETGWDASSRRGQQQIKGNGPLTLDTIPQSWAGDISRQIGVTSARPGMLTPISSRESIGEGP